MISLRLISRTLLTSLALFYSGLGLSAEPIIVEIAAHFETQLTNTSTGLLNNRPLDIGIHGAYKINKQAKTHPAKLNNGIYGVSRTKLKFNHATKKSVKFGKDSNISKLHSVGSITLKHSLFVIHPLT